LKRAGLASAQVSIVDRKNLDENLPLAAGLPAASGNCREAL